MFHTFDTSDMPFDLLLIVQYLAPSTPLTSKSHSIYNVDSNSKSLNYMKIRFKGLIYFELQQSSNQNFELKPLWIRYQLNALQISGTLN